MIQPIASFRLRIRLIAFVSAVCFLIAFGWQPRNTLFAQADPQGQSTIDPAAKQTNGPVPRWEKQDIAKLENVFRVDTRVISGGSPETAEQFQALKSLGVTTIVSVDGAPPKVELANSAGIRYIHLPIGYNGVTPEVSSNLARVIKQSSVAGKIYVHCHHGKHRGPAALAAALKHLDPTWNTTLAEQFLHDAGTSSSYAGLYESVRQAKPIAKEALSQPTDKLPALVATPALVDAMVKIDETFDVMSKATSGSARAQAAALLTELFAETNRLTKFPREADAFHRLMQLSESRARTATLLAEADATVSGKESVDRDWQAELLAIKRECTAAINDFVIDITSTSAAFLIHQLAQREQDSVAVSSSSMHCTRTISSSGSSVTGQSSEGWLTVSDDPIVQTGTSTGFSVRSMTSP